MRALSPDEFSACLSIRRTVFIEEQGISEAEDVDGLDGQSRHYLLVDNGQHIATARAFPMGNIAKIQRVAVVKSRRQSGMGTALMKGVLVDLTQDGFFDRVKLGSQIHAIPFYASLGFEAFGPEYDDAGIPHRDMVRDL